MEIKEKIKELKQKILHTKDCLRFKGKKTANYSIRSPGSRERFLEK